jgi:flagellar FliJ protein
MAKFVFKLEGVLRQRKHIEQQKQRELAIRQSHFVELQNALAQLNDTVQKTTEDVRKNHLVGRLNMQFLAAHRRFLTGMHRQAMEMMQRLALSQRAVDEARGELAEAAKQRKAIEKLREKQLARWREEIAKRDLAEMDEIGMQLAYQNLIADAEPDFAEPSRGAS